MCVAATAANSTFIPMNSATRFKKEKSSGVCTKVTEYRKSITQWQPSPCRTEISRTCAVPVNNRNNQNVKSALDHAHATNLTKLQKQTETETQTKIIKHTNINNAYLLCEDVCVHGRLHESAEPAELPPAREKHARHVPQELVVRACE